MSTRCILVFSPEDNDNMDYGIPIYKHWDGYPSNVLHILRQYLYVNRKRMNDCGYLASGFLRYVENYDNRLKIPDKFTNIDGDDFESWFMKDPYTGYGLFTQQIDAGILGGWEDYYYKITPKMVYVYNHNLENIYKVTMDDLLQMPDENEYFEELQKNIHKYDGEEEYKPTIMQMPVEYGDNDE